MANEKINWMMGHNSIEAMDDTNDINMEKDISEHKSIEEMEDTNQVKAFLIFWMKRLVQIHLLLQTSLTNDFLMNEIQETPLEYLPGYSLIGL